MELGWAVRTDNPELLAAVNTFFRKEYRGMIYNVLARRYFAEPKRIRSHAEDRPLRAGRISPFDGSVQKYKSLISAHKALGINVDDYEKLGAFFLGRPLDIDF